MAEVGSIEDAHDPEVRQLCVQIKQVELNFIILKKP
jgi:hypothetical protein